MRSCRFSTRANRNTAVSDLRNAERVRVLASGRPYFLVVDNWEGAFALPTSRFWKTSGLPTSRTRSPWHGARGAPRPALSTQKADIAKVDGDASLVRVAIRRMRASNMSMKLKKIQREEVACTTSATRPFGCMQLTVSSPALCRSSEVLRANTVLSGPADQEP